MYYTKNGSIPKTETDGTEGWLEVPNPPEVPDGKELVWLNWEWVVRDPKPTDNPGMQWNWNHGDMAWVESPYGEVVIPEVIETPSSAMPPYGEIVVSEVIESPSAEPVIEMPSAEPVIELSSAGPV